MAATNGAERTVVFLTPELKEQVKTFARREDANVSAIIRRAVRKFLQEAACSAPTK